jgi:hypothetical protein
VTVKRRRQFNSSERAALYLTSEQLALFDIGTSPADRQGQGKTTELKERYIKLAVAVNSKITGHPSKFIARFPYWHFDMHAGSGWNDRVNCVGTPLAFLDEITKFPKEYRAFFCDNNSDSINKLNARPQIASSSHAYVFCGENREVLPIFAEAIRRNDTPRFANGTIVVDPNGYLSPDTVPLDLLALFCREFERIDLLMHLNVRTLALERQHIQKAIKGKWREHRLLELDEFPAFFSRRHWLISERLQGRGHRFVMMFGRNIRLGDHPTMGIYHLDSFDGQRIVAETKARAAS